MKSWSLEMYNYAIDYLAGSGYTHYEISNFARPEFQCVHNLNYWNRGDYIGAGAGAHSFISAVRSINTTDINEYSAKLNHGHIPEIQSMKLTPEDALKEYIFLGLRKTEGIKFNQCLSAWTPVYQPKKDFPMQAKNLSPRDISNVLAIF